MTNNSKHHVSLHRSFNIFSYYNTVFSSNNAKLWHRRLGHMSYSMLITDINKIQIIVPSYFNSNKCIVCPIAKLKRIPFKSTNQLSANNLILFIMIYGVVMENLLMIENHTF